MILADLKRIRGSWIVVRAGRVHLSSFPRKREPSHQLTKATPWIPAFAGMTPERSNAPPTGRGPGAEQHGQCSVVRAGRVHLSSFPRKREPSHQLTKATPWIPAFAGMTPERSNAPPTGRGPGAEQHGQWAVVRAGRVHLSSFPRTREPSHQLTKATPWIPAFAGMTPERSNAPPTGRGPGAEQHGQCSVVRAGRVHLSSFPRTREPSHQLTKATPWIPAFAGMTPERSNAPPTGRGPGAEQHGQCSVVRAGRVHLSSFPRKREPSHQLTKATPWIPAFAGMTPERSNAPPTGRGPGAEQHGQWAVVRAGRVHLSSFPRKREPSHQLTKATPWIPAFAGMTPERSNAPPTGRGPGAEQHGQCSVVRTGRAGRRPRGLQPLPRRREAQR